MIARRIELSLVGNAQGGEVGDRQQIPSAGLRPPSRDRAAAADPIHRGRPIAGSAAPRSASRLRRGLRAARRGYRPRGRRERFRAGGTANRPRAGSSLIPSPLGVKTAEEKVRFWMKAVVCPVVPSTRRLLVERASPTSAPTTGCGRTLRSLSRTSLWKVVANSNISVPKTMRIGGLLARVMRSGRWNEQALGLLGDLGRRSFRAALA